MTNAGRYVDRSLAACAVPPVNLRGDLALVKTMVDDYHRAGMGTGFTLDGLDDPVGVLRYLNEIAVTGANSGTEDRPVGNMAILSLSDPRAGELIGCKVGVAGRKVQWKFNISLHVTDAEMRAAITTAGRERELLMAAAEAAHACADPGLLFTDRMNEANPTPEVGEYVSTAPCAEVGLVVGDLPVWLRQPRPLPYRQRRHPGRLGRAGRHRGHPGAGTGRRDRGQPGLLPQRAVSAGDGH